ncbi:membrane protein [Caballeronia pedi]|uniref:Membrane protein n=1 Tax=Caballeronia pedi TaxID=1777141 RepID=A0A157ZYT7_9BURK|nr:OmpW family outer membrane protein [Caballeronia pedi]SAK50712.1 membrane protein [Caballeronia pedi]
MQSHKENGILSRTAPYTTTSKCFIVFARCYGAAERWSFAANLIVGVRQTTRPKESHCISEIIVRIVIAVLVIFFSVSTANAKTANSFYGFMSGGWRPTFESRNSKYSSGPLFDPDERMTGVSFGTSANWSANLGYFVTEHIAVELGFGGSDTFKAYATVNDGARAGTPMLAKVDLGSAMQWESELSLKYFFEANNPRLHPFIGVGIAYDNTITKAMDRDYFPNSGRWISDFTFTSPYLAPVVSAGATYDLDQHWFAGLSVDVRRTRNLLSIRTDSGPNGGILYWSDSSSVNMEVLQIHPRIGIGYRF